ncbi:hypothetical protein BJ684DRAFT_18921 [Piptocephalis cylindrospora]|uniref:RGS domain-containing protein n=1 Tax=Piptocephalis cylindrospora TaxID=1907219 RepID=A0A4P9Y8K8_9FUNG|nr:hypothetical protein BJ684DRAFT_18921 [Piptocephalis cylindrospora]|eukprot:RKP14691.1 hypothetical protein BJ684DRAFT_18921 [Piptocephalis cylindrospora]
MTPPSSSGFTLPPPLRPRASSGVLSLPQEESLDLTAILNERASDPTYVTLMPLLQEKVKAPCTLRDFHRYLRALDKARSLHLAPPVYYPTPAPCQDDSGHAVCEVDPLPLSAPESSQEEPLRQPSFSPGYFTTPPLSPCSGASSPESPDFHISVFDEEEFLTMEEAPENGSTTLPTASAPIVSQEAPGPPPGSPTAPKRSVMRKSSMGRTSHRPPPILLIPQSPPSTPSFPASPVTPRSPFSPALPYQDEVDRAVTRFITSSHLLPYTVKDTIVHSLAHSTHPDILMPAIDAALDLLVLPAQSFTQDAVQNLSPPTAHLRVLLASVSLVLGLSLVAILIFSEFSRWWRLIPLPWISVSIGYIVTHAHGIDPMRAWLGLSEPRVAITYRSRLLSGWRECYGSFVSALRGRPYIFLGKPLVTPSSAIQDNRLLMVEEPRILQIQRAKSLLLLGVSSALAGVLWLVILLIPASF